MSLAGLMVTVTIPLVLSMLIYVYLEDRQDKKKVSQNEQILKK